MHFLLITYPSLSQVMLFNTMKLVLASRVYKFSDEEKRCSGNDKYPCLELFLSSFKAKTFPQDGKCLNIAYKLLLKTAEMAKSFNEAIYEFAITSLAW